MSIFRDEKIWRMLTNIWTVAFIVFIIINFVMKDRFEYLVAPFSFVYIGLLGLYAGTKEFDRWYRLHHGRHPGEWFVIIWTGVIFCLVIFSMFLGKEYKVSSETVATYIMILSVFALTQRSKRLHEESLRGKSKKEK